MPMKAACACDPEDCMCPSNSGCEHNGTHAEETKEISTCRLSSCSQRVTFHSAWDRDVPILAHHSDSFVPYPLHSSLEFLLTDFASQQYLSPPEKPPQILIT